MKTQLTNYAERLRLLQAFADQYDNGTIPGNYMHTSIDAGLCTVRICISDQYGFRKDISPESMLCAAGDLFGRAGWTRKVNYSHTGFDWLKTVEGVEIRLADAERIHNPADGSPVAPGAFPLLLAENGAAQPAEVTE